MAQRGSTRCKAPFTGWAVLIYHNHRGKTACGVPVVVPTYPSNARLEAQYPQS